jgi:hypothetical protein
VFDSSGPDVSGMTSSPADGATVVGTPTFQLTDPASDSGAGVAYYLLYLDDDINANPPPTHVFQNGATTWDPGFLASGTHQYTIVAVDWTGNSTVGQQQSFTIS